MGKLSVIQFNAKFTALAFRIDASESILMDYYRKALSPAVFQRALSRPDWPPCTTLANLMHVAILAAHQEEATALSHCQRQLHHASSNTTPISGVVIPPDPMAMDVSAVNSNYSTSTTAKRPATRFPFDFHRELCQARGVCWRCQKSFDDVHQNNKAAGKQICPNAAVTASDMDAFCVSCTSTSPVPIPSSPTPVQSIASTVASHALLPPSSVVSPSLPVVSNSLSIPLPAPSLPHPSFYQYPPHFFPSSVNSPYVPGPAYAPLVFPLPTSQVTSTSPSPAQDSSSVSAIFSEYRDLDKPRFYDLPSLTESSHLVSALSFTGPSSSDP